LIESAGELVSTTFDTVVTRFERNQGKWNLWSHDVFLGEFDWLAVTTPQIFSRRWADLHSLEVSPGLALLEVAPPPQCCMEPTYCPDMSALLTFTISKSAAVHIKTLDYDCLEIMGDDVLSFIIFERRLQGDALSLTLHSTPSFARAHLDQTGVASYIHRQSEVQRKSWTRAKEDAVIFEMLAAFRALTQKVCPSNEVRKVFRGDPVHRMLHRWRSAWPTEENRERTTPGDSRAPGFILHPESRLLYLGECVNVICPRDNCAEFALLGAHAAGLSVRSASSE
jgi:hypothetical protein